MQSREDSVMVPTQGMVRMGTKGSSWAPHMFAGIRHSSFGNVTAGLGHTHAAILRFQAGQRRKAVQEGDSCRLSTERRGWWLDGVATAPSSGGCLPRVRPGGPSLTCF